MPRHIASTNIELLSQLHVAGWPKDALKTMQSVYEVVAVISFESFRPNWKPFISHLVGVASIVAWDSRDPIRVGAAMAHSVLEFGRVPLMFRWPRSRRTTFLRHRLDGETLALIVAYSRANWGLLMDPDHEAAEADMKVQHIKLADLLDDFTDELSPVKTKKRLKVDLSRSDRIAACVAMAARIGCGNLSAAYAALPAQQPCPSVIDAPRSHTFSLRRGI